MQHLKRFFVNGWRGQSPLFGLFWQGFLLSFILWSVVMSSGLLYGYVEGWDEAAKRSYVQQAKAFGSILLLPFYIWYAVSLWRCAQQAKQVWKVIARIFSAFILTTRIAKIYLVMPVIMNSI